MWKREKATYLPHPGHSYYYADNGGPLVFVSPKTTFTASVCIDFDSWIRHERRHRCSDIKCRGRLHKRWSVPLFVSSHVFFFFFFFSMELLGPGLTLRCYWATQTQSPASVRATWPPLISLFLYFAPFLSMERTYEFQFFHDYAADTEESELETHILFKIWNNNNNKL